MGTLGWLGGSPEWARRWPWQTVEVGGGTPAISSYGKLRRGWLLRLANLADIYGVGEGSGWRR